MTRSLFLIPLLALVSFGCAAPETEDPGDKCEVVDPGPPATDACQNEVDLGWLQADQKDAMTGRELAREAAGDCGLACLSECAPGDCAVKCMTNRKSVSLSKTCSSCYGDIVICTIDKCLTRCISDPQAPDCKACQEEKGCQAAFDACTGPLGEEA